MKICFILAVILSLSCSKDSLKNPNIDQRAQDYEETQIESELETQLKLELESETQ